MRLSPESIQELAICPRRFQHLFVDQLVMPVPLEQQRQLTDMSRLRLLLRQAELGLLPSTADPEDRALHQAVMRLMQTVPELAAIGVCESDVSRTLPLQQHLLTVSDDRVIVNDQRARILLWSTPALLPDATSLAEHWQIRLALFVLAETSGYAPEQIALTYWVVPIAAEEVPTAHSIPYSPALHQQIAAELTQLLSDLSHWLQQYDAGTPFPQTPNPDPCFACVFARRCQRGLFNSADRPNLPELANLEAIAEVALEPS